MTDLAVIVVSWNTRDLTCNALRTLKQDIECGGLDSEIWVVDNASTDGSPEAIRLAFPDVRLLAESKNHGFAGGNNIALRALGYCDDPTPNPNGPKAVFLLNSDTLTQAGVVRNLYDALFSLPGAGLVGAQLAYEDGSFQHGAFAFPGLAQLILDLFPLPPRIVGRFYESRLNGRYPRSWYIRGEPFQVDFTLGATMMLRSAAIEQTGLFDEQFFMYCEEIDWATRIRNAGWNVYTVPAAHITHLSGRSTLQVRPQSFYNLWASRYLLFKKHYSPLQMAVARQLVKLGLTLQIRRSRAVQGQESMLDAYRRIITLYS
jgi:GT2 family glycosyltransferase